MIDASLRTTYYLNNVHHICRKLFQRYDHPNQLKVTHFGKEAFENVIDQPYNACIQCMAKL